MTIKLMSAILLRNGLTESGVHGALLKIRKLSKHFQLLQNKIKNLLVYVAKHFKKLIGNRSVGGAQESEKPVFDQKLEKIPNSILKGASQNQNKNLINQILFNLDLIIHHQLQWSHQVVIITVRLTFKGQPVTINR